MKALVGAALAVALAAATVPALADIIVFKDGRVEEIPITAVTDEAVTVQSPYGDLAYPRTAVYWFCKSVPEKPGEEYYVTGLVMLRVHNKTKAQELFTKAIALNEQYKPLVKSAWADYTRGPTEPKAEQKLHVVLTCPLCGGRGKIALTRSGGSSLGQSGAQGGAGTEFGPATVLATCPACSGRGYRLLEVGADEGVCPTCLGAGCVAGSVAASMGQSQSHTFGGADGSSTTSVTGSATEGPPYAPCPTCGGFGVIPVKRGGVREQIDEALNANRPEFTSPNGGGSSSSSGDGEEVEEDKGEGEEETPSGGDESFISKYRTYLLIGGGALLVVAIAASQLSKKK